MIISAPARPTPSEPPLLTPYGRKRFGTIAAIIAVVSIGVVVVGTAALVVVPYYTHVAVTGCQAKAASYGPQYNAATGVTATCDGLGTPEGNYYSPLSQVRQEITFTMFGCLSGQIYCAMSYTVDAVYVAAPFTLVGSETGLPHTYNTSQGASSSYTFDLFVEVQPPSASGWYAATYSVVIT